MSKTGKISSTNRLVKAFVILLKRKEAMLKYHTSRLPYSDYRVVHYLVKRISDIRRTLSKYGYKSV